MNENRYSPLNIDENAFRQLGHSLVNEIATLMEYFSEKK